LNAIERKRAELSGRIGARAPSSTVSTTKASTPAAKPRKRKKFSAAHRAKLSEAAQKSWAKRKGIPKQAAVNRPQASARKAVPKSTTKRSEKKS
jgi:hypothetical protein